MNDLLPAVRGARQGSDQDRPPSRRTKNPLYTGDIEEGQPPSAGGGTELDMDMAEFFTRVGMMKADLAAIRSLQSDITAHHDAGKTLVKSKAVKQHQMEMQDMINSVSSLAHTVRRKLEAVDADNARVRSKRGQGLGSASERTRTTLTAGLRKKLLEVMSDFSALRTRIQQEYRALVERRVFTVTGKHVPDGDIDVLIEGGEAEGIFQQAILEQGRGCVLDTLREIHERHQGVRDLEQGLLELHQIFLDMAVLVEAQGEMLDNIEKQVERSVGYVSTGLELLEGAREHQRSKRKWMCWGVAILLLIAVIIVLVVVKPWQYLKR